MAKESKTGAGIGFKIYVIAGIVVFSAIFFTVLTKPQKTQIPTSSPPTEIMNTRTPTTTNETEKDKSDRLVMEQMETKMGANPSADDYFRMGFVYYNNKKFNKCIEMNRKALELDPNLASAYNNICSAYNSMGKWDSAILACDRALQIQPDFAMAQNNRNWAYKNRSERK